MKLERQRHIKGDLLHIGSYSCMDNWAENALESIMNISNDEGLLGNTLFDLEILWPSSCHDQITLQCRVKDNETNQAD